MAGGTAKIRVGVIGCGEWGPNQIRTFFFHPETAVTRVCDQDPKRLHSIQNQYPGVQVTPTSQEITRAPDIDAVVICTPVSTHFQLAQDALQHGKDVLCEKPLTLTSVEAEKLVQLAEEKGRVLMVGHVFVFNPGILKLKEIVQYKECGEIRYLHAQRTNLGPVRKDVNAVYDLAAHDISIFNFLLEATPKVLTAVGKCYLQPQVEDVAFLSLEYPNNVLAHIHVSWLDPKKVREITIVGDRKMVMWNDLSLTGPVQIFSKRIEREPFYDGFGEFQLLARDGEVLIPSVALFEPLKKQAIHFVECLKSRKKPIADGRNGLHVVQTLEEANRLLQQKS